MRKWPQLKCYRISENSWSISAESSFRSHRSCHVLSLSQRVETQPAPDDLFPNQLKYNTSSIYSSIFYVNVNSIIIKLNWIICNRHKEVPNFGVPQCFKGSRPSEVSGYHVLYHTQTTKRNCHFQFHYTKWFIQKCFLCKLDDRSRSQHINYILQLYGHQTTALIVWIFYYFRNAGKTNVWKNIYVYMYPRHLTSSQNQRMSGKFSNFPAKASVTEGDDLQQKAQPQKCHEGLNDKRPFQRNFSVSHYCDVHTLTLRLWWNLLLLRKKNNAMSGSPLVCWKLPTAEAHIAAFKEVN